MRWPNSGGKRLSLSDRRRNIEELDKEIVECRRRRKASAHTVL
jgi:hypothetical protein